MHCSVWYKHFQLSQSRQVNLKKYRSYFLNLLAGNLMCSKLDLSWWHRYLTKPLQQSLKIISCFTKIASLILCLLMGNNSLHLSWIHCCIHKNLCRNKDLMSIIFCKNNMKELVLNKLYMSKDMWMLLIQGEDWH